jgi:hydrocephalus-inducing protein
VNNGDATIRFRWNAGDKEEFKFYPGEGLLKGHSSKRMKIMVKGIDKKKYDKIDLNCELSQVEQPGDFQDWDDTMKTLRMVRPSEHRKIMRDRELMAQKRKEELEAAALAATGKKAAKPPAKDKKKGEEVEEDIEIDESEDANVELIEVIPEPETTTIENSEKTVMLKASCVIDHASYECNVSKVDFKPTLMYASRSYKFTIKNTSLINLDFNFKIVNSNSGILDAGPYSIIPKKGCIAPGCDDNFIVKYSPVEVEADNSRILSANIRNLSGETEPLIIEVNGVAERPIIHFELPNTTYRERKEKDMTPVDAKFKIIEFESLGTMIRNTKRFMAVNPTATGYEFEWEEIQEQGKVLKPMFKCTTPKGLILSGKKSEMVFEYTPDSVGEHESKWLFKIPQENIQQHFLIVGRVNEPNVLFESGKIRFGPLLLQGKNKETVRIINQEEIPFAFNFARDSIRGSPDYGDSLKVTPVSGVVPAQSDLPIEVQFTPKFELTYNYNLTCNVKRKARPLVLNVKGEGYKIHHKIFAGEPRVEVSQPASGQAASCPIDFGEFFINERKVRKVTL